MAGDHERYVRGEHIYLPVASMGEEHTHVECPACDPGEVIIASADEHECRSCGAAFRLRLVPEADDGFNPH